MLWLPGGPMPGPIYAQQGSASQALVLTEKNEVPQDERLAAWQIKNFRPSREVVQENAVAYCISSLQQFVNMPPANVCVWEGAVCTAEHIQICFHPALAGVQP